MALAGIIAGYPAEAIGARVGLFVFGLAVIVPANSVLQSLVADFGRATGPVTSVAARPPEKSASGSARSRPACR